MNKPERILIIHLDAIGDVLRKDVPLVKLDGAKVFSLRSLRLCGESKSHN